MRMLGAFTHLRAPDERWGSGAGVSAVIATLLLVAIGMVMTIAVLAVVNPIGQQKAEGTMVAQFERVEESDGLVVQSAAGGSDWSRMSVRLQNCSQAIDNGVVRLGASLPYQNDEAIATGAALNAAATGTACGAGSMVAVAYMRADVRANDFIDFCGSPARAALSGVAISLVDTSANAVLGTFTFLSVSDC